MSTIAVAQGFGSTRTTRSRPVGRSAVVPDRVRLTRRAQVLLLVAFLALVFSVFTVFGDRSVATAEQGTPVPTRTVEVGSGDTLWAIASAVAGPGEVREMIHQIKELNALPSAALVEGQELAVPIS